MHYRPFLTAAVLMLSIQSVGCGEERTTVYLADIEYEARNVFSTSQSDTVPNHLHEFGAGFGRVERDGRWILGKEATLHLMAVGKRMRLEIDCSTKPALSEKGQALTIVWNGYDLGTHPVDAGWQRVMVVGRVPPIAIEEGRNEILLRPALALAMEDEPRPLSVYVKGVRLIADFTAAEQVAWETMVEKAGSDGEEQ